MKYQPIFNHTKLLLLEELLTDIKISDNLLDNLKTMYEWEWKLGEIDRKSGLADRHRLMYIHPKRLSNIIHQIERRLNPVIDCIAEKLILVFEDWLDKHAILEPRLWAEKRVGEKEAGGDSEYIYTCAIGEYIRYKFPSGWDDIDENERLNSAQKEFVKVNIDEYENLAKDFVQSEYDNISEEIENEDDLEEKKELQDRLKIVEDYLDKPLEYVEEYLGIDEFIEIINLKLVVTEESIINFYEKVVFPLWYGKWSQEGIDETRENIENINNDLNNLQNLVTFKEKSAIINIALQMQHQTGSMMDYIEELYEVSGDALKQLTTIGNDKINSWKADLKDMGL